MTPAVPSLLTRREALARLSCLVAGSIVGAEFFLAGGRLEGKEPAAALAASDLALLDEIGDTIVPGARATGIGAFMAMMAADCYDGAHEAAFRDGLGQIDRAARHRFGRAFTACTVEDRTALLNDLDREARASHSQPPHYFRLMKQLALLGYFTSQAGCTEALRYKEVPGSFDGDVPYRKGDRAWFTPMRSGLL